MFLSEEMFPSNVVGFGTQHGSPHGDHVVSWSFEKCSRKDMRSASTPAENYVNTLPDVAFKRRRLYSIGSSRDDEGGADGIRREPVEAAGRENTEQLGASNRTAFRQGTRECWLGPHLYSNTLQSDVRDSKFVSQQVLSSGIQMNLWKFCARRAVTSACFLQTFLVPTVGTSRSRTSFQIEASCMTELLYLLG